MSAKEDLEALAGKIKENLPGVTPKIPVAFIANSQSKLLRSVLDPESQADSFKLRNDEYPIKFSEPVYINRIEFVIDGAVSSALKKLKIQVIDFVGKKTEMSFSPQKDSNVAICWIRAVVTEIDISSVAGILGIGSVHLKGIAIYGYGQIEFDTLSEKISKVISIKSDFDSKVALEISRAEKSIASVSEKQVELNQINLKITEANDAISSLEEKIQEEEAKKEDLIASVNDLSTKELSLKSVIKDLSNTVDEKQAEKSSLISEIVQIKQELDSLRRDKSLFTEDIKGYIKRGSDDIGLYTILAFLPICIMFYVTYNLFCNSQAILSYDFSKNATPMIDFLLSRLPYTIVSVVIIEVCFRICLHFVSRIIELNKDRLNISRVSIIARDVSDSIFSGIDVEDEEIKFHLMAKLKMDMIKAHLSKDVGKEYEYDPAMQVELPKRSLVRELISKVLDSNKTDKD